MAEREAGHFGTTKDEQEIEMYGYTEAAVLKSANEFLTSPLRFGQAPREAAIDLACSILSDAQTGLDMIEDADRAKNYARQQMNQAKLVLWKLAKVNPNWGL